MGMFIYHVTELRTNMLYSQCDVITQT